MHDPMTVAFEIPRPWPQRQTHRRSRNRWRFRGRFWSIAGRELYWPGLVTIWHHDPSDYDSTTCTGKGWRWHVRHWRFQVHPVQHLRRWALTRCEWCGGKSRKGGRVNHGFEWDGPRAKWWQPEAGLYHSECVTARLAWKTCICDTPHLGHHGVNKDGTLIPRDYGECAACGGFREWRQSAEATERARRTREAAPRNTRPAR